MAQLLPVSPECRPPGSCALLEEKSGQLVKITCTQVGQNNIIKNRIIVIMIVQTADIVFISDWNTIRILCIIIIIVF